MIAFPRHWSSRYFRDRGRLALHQALHRDDPWFTPEAVVCLERLLQRGDLVFEWGAGRSTAWFARRVDRVVTVEHDARWHARVMSRLQQQQLHNVDLHLFANNRQAYVDAIDAHPRTYDLICIDGVSDLRGLCALRALRHVAPNRYLLVDDVHRYLPSASRAPLALPEGGQPPQPEWAEFAQRVAGWECVWTSSGVTDTALWRRPDTAAPCKDDADCGTL